MPEWKARSSGSPIRKQRIKLAEFRQASARRLKRSRRALRWFVRGAIIGAVWAVLYAPQSGTETRHAVSQRLCPLAEFGKTLLAWLRHMQHGCQDHLTARQAPGPSGQTSEE